VGTEGGHNFCLPFWFFVSAVWMHFVLWCSFAINSDQFRVWAEKNLVWFGIAHISRKISNENSRFLRIECFRNQVRSNIQLLSNKLTTTLMRDQSPWPIITKLMANYQHGLYQSACMHDVVEWLLNWTWKSMLEMFIGSIPIYNCHRLPNGPKFNRRHAQEFTFLHLQRCHIQINISRANLVSTNELYII
jgi:hypothetical protein